MANNPQVNVAQLVGLTIPQLYTSQNAFMKDGAKQVNFHQCVFVMEICVMRSQHIWLQTLADR